MRAIKYFTGVAGIMVSVGYTGSAVAELVYSMDVESHYDDNIYLLEDDKVDSWIEVIRPNVVAEITGGGSKVGLDVGAESGTYTQHGPGDDDYTDYHVTGFGVVEFDIRNHLNIELEHEKGHNNRGSGREDIPGKTLALFADSPDQWRNDTAVAIYSLGAEDSKARVDLGVETESREYTNNRSGTLLLDHSDIEYKAVGYLKVMPRTSLVLEARTRDIDYDETAPINRDGTDNRYYLGIDWNSTAKTTGMIRFGYQEKDPDSQALNDFSATAWEAKVVWKPKSYSALSLETFRGAEDSSNNNSTVDVAYYILEWKHDWTSRLGSQVYYTYKTNEYEDNPRDDVLQGFGFAGAYEITEWLNFRAAYEYRQRDSSLIGLDYDQNSVVLGLQMELR